MEVTEKEPMYNSIRGKVLSNPLGTKIYYIEFESMGTGKYLTPSLMGPENSRAATCIVTLYRPARPTRRARHTDGLLSHKRTSLCI